MCVCVYIYVCVKETYNVISICEMMDESMAGMDKDLNIQTQQDKKMRTQYHILAKTYECIIRIIIRAWFACIQNYLCMFQRGYQSHEN